MNYARKSAAVLLVAFCLAQIACDPIRELNKGAYRAQAVIHQVPPALVDMEAQQVITHNQQQEIASAGKDVNSLNEEFIAMLEPAAPGGPEPKWTPALKASVIAKIDQIVAAVDRLNNKGTLHIHNPSSKAIFDGFISSLRTILKSAKEAV